MINPFLQQNSHDTTNNSLPNLPTTSGGLPGLNTGNYPYNLSSLPDSRDALQELLLSGQSFGNGVFLYSIGIGTHGALTYESENEWIRQASAEGKILHFENGLPRVDTIHDELGKQTVNAMNRTWVTVNKAKDLTSEMIIKLTYKNHRSLISDREIKVSLDAIFQDYLDVYLNSNQSLEVMKNVYIKLILWAETIIPQLIDVSPGTPAKAIIVENVSKRDSTVFLSMLAKLGFKVYYRSMEGFMYDTGTQQGIQAYLEPIKQGELYTDNPINSQDFALLLQRERDAQKESEDTIQTIASTASIEVQELLSGDGMGILHDWQFENSRVKAKRLQTTYDEMLLLWDEPANMRSGFAYNQATDTLEVPTIFAKVSGVHDDIEKYWLDYSILRYPDTSQVLVDIDFGELEYNMQRNVPKYRNLRYQGGTVGFDAQEILNHPEYPYSYLRTGLQNQIIYALNEVLLSADMTNSDRYLFLTAVFSLPQEILLTLQNFDYAKTAPKVVLYHSNEEQPPTSVGYVLDFLHEVGCDVVVLVPSGYRNIENVLVANRMQEHRLTQLSPNLEIPEITEKRESSTESKSIFKRMGKFFMP